MVAGSVRHVPASKINPARIARLLKLVKNGNYLRYAAEATGIHFTTVYDWEKRGDNELAAARAIRPEIDAEIADWILVFLDDFKYTDPENPMWTAPPPTPFTEDNWQYVLLAVLMKRAKAESITESVGLIRGHARQQWQAAAWYLERVDYANFGRKSAIEHSGPDGGPIVTTSPEDLIERLRALKREKALIDEAKNKGKA